MKERCQLLVGPEFGFRKKKHVSVGFTLLRCYTFMLKKFTFSLSAKNTEFPTSLDGFLSLFLSLRVFSLCLDKFPRRRWTKSPQRGRNSSESHTSEKECFLSYSWLCCILVCDWSKVSTNHNSLLLVEPL